MRMQVKMLIIVLFIIIETEKIGKMVCLFDENVPNIFEYWVRLKPTKYSGQSSWMKMKIQY